MVSGIMKAARIPTKRKKPVVETVKASTTGKSILTRTTAQTTTGAMPRRVLRNSTDYLDIRTATGTPRLPPWVGELKVRQQ